MDALLSLQQTKGNVGTSARAQSIVGLGTTVGTGQMRRVFREALETNRRTTAWQRAAKRMCRVLLEEA